MPTYKAVKVDRETLIHALRKDGFVIPDNAALTVGDYTHEEISFVYDADQLKTFLVTHYELKGYRDGEPTTEEPGDWQSPETGTYTRVVEAQDLRTAIALAGPIPSP